MKKELAGRTAMASDGASGIGLALAEPCLAEGMKVAINEGWKSHLQAARTSTHQEDMMGSPATGKQVKVYGMEMDRFKNDKTVETWDYGDVMGLMQQCGANGPQRRQ
jgi:NAD(P)-dependent dehydrogenase (short-subunit alcohol dehydrogenase family)